VKKSRIINLLLFYDYHQLEVLLVPYISILVKLLCHFAILDTSMTVHRKCVFVLISMGISDKRAVVHCLNNYCDYSSCPVGSEFCNVSSFECSSHRSGIACGSCAENYTLPFDSNKCIPIDTCQALWLCYQLGLYSNSIHSYYF